MVLIVETGVRVERLCYQCIHFVDWAKDISDRYPDLDYSPHCYHPNLLDRVKGEPKNCSWLRHQTFKENETCGFNGHYFQEKENVDLTLRRNRAKGIQTAVAGNPQNLL